MMELILASSVVAAMLLATTQRPDRSREPSLFGLSPVTMPTLTVEDLHLDYADLPCPWCSAATREDDKSCPSCGQRFG